VRDLTCAQISLPTQTPGFAIPVPYQYFPLVSGISSEIPGFDNISSIALPYVSSLDLEQAQGKEVTAKPLLTSSDKSGRDEGFFILNPDRFNNLTSIARDTLFALKGIVLGAVYTGKFKSFYAGKQISEDTSKNFIRTYSGNVLEESKKESKMLVIGDGDFPNELNKPPKDNLIFFNDIIEYLAIEINLNETTKNQ
jgi:hypothetical protein